MLIKTPNKELAFRAVINTWLKDKTLYCNNCGKDFDPEKDSPLCCDLPHIGRNIDHCKGIINQNKEISKTRLNEFGSNQDKNIRFGLSLPPSLFNVLDNFKKMHNQPGLFKEEGEINWFMKKFPEFKTCSRT
jgi:hypothetical protein